MPVHRDTVSLLMGLHRSCIDTLMVWDAIYLRESLEQEICLIRIDCVLIHFMVCGAGYLRESLAKNSRDFTDLILILSWVVTKAILGSPRDKKSVEFAN